ncbi:palmitoyltransferase PFA4 [Dendrothele bispora CBS 962.96]|uniref:Palmitoyltransferase PFA4 n=1 Tax=Dendrothele bispora (strain CBS 962.96) TaxID=1314807 RepID=A0A4S8MW06_DENBC|nr:palmitoyltransferase PFA4 [Dendrothele bispora CBS 962.96]
MHRFWGWLIVNLVLCLISFIAYSSQIFIIWPWYGNALSVELLTLLLPFNFLVGMLLWNYFLCVNTDPGQVPDKWRPDTHTDGFEVNKLTRQPRYCRTCESYKPPRAHHCRQCNRCVLRMDHHCPWINNCVGHFNYGHFIRFLFFVDVACSYHIAMVSYRVMDANRSPTAWNWLSSTELIFIILNYVACVPVLLAVGGFSLLHFHSLLGNTTTIERWEKDKAATMVRYGRIQSLKFPYNLGNRRNIESVLGTNFWLWCCPTRTLGNGLKYELNAVDGEPLESWPPKDPDHSHYEDPVAGFQLPDTPWTFENGSFNPDLQPSNSAIRQNQNQAKRRRKANPASGTSDLPPYHPDYQSPNEMDAPDDSGSSDSGSGLFNSSNGTTRVRRGSEGYEVKLEDRNLMLRKYLESVGETPGRYHRYIPMPDSESEDEVEGA